jgi:hypothetical protein
VVSQEAEPENIDEVVLSQLELEEDLLTVEKEGRRRASFRITSSRSSRVATGRWGRGGM